MTEVQFRFDSIPMVQTYATSEGYLYDNPIVTTTGIFEYHMMDGSVRRELRLPEEVFDPASLDSYEGKPIIITHSAGAVTAENVDQEIIGTILSKGKRDGENVRVKIVVHDTNALEDCGLRELSLGYNMTLDETPGEWEGQPYDVIQRNIRINHLALVSKARAGDTARLNLDGQVPQNEGGTKMATKAAKKTTSRVDGVTPEELQAAVEAYKARKTARTLPPPTGDSADDPKPAADSAEEGGAPVGEQKADADDTVQAVKDRRDRRDAEEDPSTPEAAMGVIAQQDEDIESLLQVVAELMARGDSDDTKPKEDGEDPPAPQGDGEGDVLQAAKTNQDGSGDKSGSMNMDSADYLIRQRMEVARLGEKLRLNGLESLTLRKAKEKIIQAVRPELRLDGKDASYISAAYDIARAEADKRGNTSTDDQRREMFRPVQVRMDGIASSESASARQRMIQRQMNGGK